MTTPTPNLKPTIAGEPLNQGTTFLALVASGYSDMSIGEAALILGAKPCPETAALASLMFQPTINGEELSEAHTAIDMVDAQYRSMSLGEA